LPEVSRPIRYHQKVCEVCGDAGTPSPSRSWRLCCDEVWDYSSANDVVAQVLRMLMPDPALTRMLSLQAQVELLLPLVPSMCKTRLIAKLVDLRAICGPCNAATHWGFSEMTGDETTAITQIQRVNGWDIETLYAKVTRARLAWAIMSAMPGWTITWDGWETIRDRKAGRTRRRRLRTNGLDRAFTIGDSPT